MFKSKKGLKNFLKKNHNKKVKEGQRKDMWKY